MKRDFYIDQIKTIENSNELSILLNSLEEVSKVRISEQSIRFECYDDTNLQEMINRVDPTLHIQEVVGKKTQDYQPVVERKKQYFLFTNLESIEDAQKIEETLQRYSMYEDVHIDFTNKALDLVSDDPIVLKRLNRIVDRVNPDIDVEQWKRPYRSKQIFKEKYLTRLIKVAALLIAAALGLVTMGESSIFTYIGWIIAIFVSLENVLIRAKNDIRRKEFFSENVLIVLGAIAGLVYGAYIETILVSFVYQIGDVLLVKIIGKTMDRIDEKVSLPQLGRREVSPGCYEMISLTEFDIDDVMVVYPGELIKLGGEIIEGTSQIDNYAVDGNEVYVSVKTGDEVSSGSTNVDNELRISVRYLYNRSAFHKLLHIASMTPTYYSSMQQLIENVSKYVSKALVAIALISIGFAIYNVREYRDSLYFAAIVITMSGRFAFKQASSFSVLAGVANAFDKGIIIKENSGLDALNQCSTIIYDRFDGVEVTMQEMDLFERLSELHKKLIIFNDGPVDLENDQYDIHNNLSVEEKLAVMEQASLTGEVVYIGDTSKDIDLLKRAYVGVSRGGLHDHQVTRSSEILLIDSNDQTIEKMFEIARKQRSIFIQNTIIGTVGTLLIVLLAWASLVIWVEALGIYIALVCFILLNTRRLLD